MRNCVFWDQSSNFPVYSWQGHSLSWYSACRAGVTESREGEKRVRLDEGWGLRWWLIRETPASEDLDRSERDGTGSWQLLMFQDHLRLVIGGRGGSLFICFWQVCCTAICSLCLLPLDWKIFIFLLSCLPAPPLLPNLPLFPPSLHSFWDRTSLCSPDRTVTWYVDQADLELTEILLPLTPRHKCWD